MDRQQLERFQTLLREASATQGVVRLDKLRDAVDLQFGSGDIDGAAESLMTLIEEASQEGQYDRELAAFQRLRGIHASDARYDYLRPKILWYFKWIAEHAQDHADVSVQSMETVWSEMEAFYRESAAPLRPYYSIRFQVADEMGRTEEAEAWYQRWLGSADERTTNDDCAACEVARKVEYHLMRREGAEAIEAAGPLLAGEVRWCNSTPDLLTRLSVPALQSGRADLAFWTLHVTGRLVRRRMDRQRANARLLLVRCLVGPAILARRQALALAKRLDDAKSDAARFAGLRSLGYWTAMLRLQGVDRLRVIRCDLFPEPEIATAEAATQCLDAARDLAARFDARNGNRYFGEGVEMIEMLIRRYAQAAAGTPSDATPSDPASDRASDAAPQPE